VNPDPFVTAESITAFWAAFANLPTLAQTALIDTTNEKLQEFIRRPILQNTLVVNLDGQNSPTLWLKLTPIIQVTSVIVNGFALDNTYNTAWNFEPLTGKLSRGSGLDDPRFCPWFPKGQQNVQVTYFGGYQTMPARLTMAGVYMAKYLYEQTKITGIYSAESIGDYSYTLNAAYSGLTVPPHVCDMCAGFVEDLPFA
jgi:hypothetical protein